MISSNNKNSSSKNASYVQAKEVMKQISELRQNLYQLYQSILIQSQPENILRNNITNYHQQQYGRNNNANPWDLLKNQVHNVNKNQNLNQQYNNNNNGYNHSIPHTHLKEEFIKTKINQHIDNKFKLLASHIQQLVKTIDKKILILTKSIEKQSGNINQYSTQQYKKVNKIQISKHQYQIKDSKSNIKAANNINNNRKNDQKIQFKQQSSHMIPNIQKKTKSRQQQSVNYDQFINHLEKSLENKPSDKQFIGTNNQNKLQQQINNFGFIQDQHQYKFDNQDFQQFQSKFNRNKRPKIFNNPSLQKNNLSQNLQFNQKTFSKESQKKQNSINQKYIPQEIKTNSNDKIGSIQNDSKNYDSIDKKHRLQFLVKSLINP